MKKQTIALALCLAVAGAGCNKILDTQVQDFASTQNFFNTETDINRAVLGVYDVLGSSELYASEMLGRMALDGDEAFYSGTQITGLYVNDVNASDVQIYAYWRKLYEGINRANLALANIGKPRMDSTRRKTARAELRFLRAYYYFMLTAQFGGVPLVTEPTEVAENKQLARSPQLDCYQFIKNEMDAAATDLPTATSLGFGGRLSKTTAWGILTRVCLYMAGKPLFVPGMHQQARDYAKRIIDGNEHDLNASYSQVFINYGQDRYDVKESMWEVEFFGNGLDVFRETGRIGSNNGIRQVADNSIGTANGFINTTGRHFRSYTTGDLRRDYAIAPFRFSGNPAVKTNWTTSQQYDRNCGKWRRENELLFPRTANTPQNYPLLRYADVLLMYAEAENEVNGGPNAAAYNALNMVRRRAFGKPIRTPDAQADAPANLSKTAFHNFLIDERSRELCFECLRKRDLVRWGIYVPKMKVIANDFVVDAMSSTWRIRQMVFVNTTERDELWPIPQRDRELNSLLTQNPGF